MLDQRRIYLIKKLIEENSEYKDLKIPQSDIEQKALLRALFNVRLPKEISPEFKLIQDQYLQFETVKKGIVGVENFKDGMNIWQGDITRLKVDAIVNAANNGMTGCYVPNHSCIDNAIHTFAGIELRNECDKLMKKQGYPEPTGQAKITPAFNLPSKYVIHTVGPIVENTQLTEIEKEQLASSYHSSLEIAAENAVKSIAFPCISTGVFHFPNQLAAEIAVKTVKEFMQNNNEIEKVIFNVFKNQDKEIYERLLK